MAPHLLWSAGGRGQEAVWGQRLSCPQGAHGLGKRTTHSSSRERLGQRVHVAVPPGHMAVPSGHLGEGMVLLATKGWKPGMLLSTLQGPGQPAGRPQPRMPTVPGLGL